MRIRAGPNAAFESTEITGRKTSLVNNTLVDSHHQHTKRMIRKRGRLENFGGSGDLRSGQNAEEKAPVRFQVELNSANGLPFGGE